MLSSFVQLGKRLSLRVLKNFYVIATVLFVVWMVFFDSSSLLSNRRLHRKESDLQAQKLYYQEEIEKTKRNMQELYSNPELLEKYAREKYHFKRPGEDIYIIEEK